MLLYCVPIVLSLAGCSSKLLIPGKINYYIYLGNWLIILLLFYSGIVFYDLKINQNYARTYNMLVIRTLSWVIFETVSILELGFITLMIDKRIGGTHLTLLGTINKLLSNFIETISLYLVGYISYEYYFIWGVGYMAIMLWNTRSYAMILDEADPSEFIIKEENDSELSTNCSIMSLDKSLDMPNHGNKTEPSTNCSIISLDNTPEKPKHKEDIPKHRVHPL